MRFVLAVLLLLALAVPVSAKPSSATCSVSPNPVAVNATFTITASASVFFDFFLTDPTGRTWTWPQGPAGTVTYDWQAPLAGNWSVTIRNIHYPHPQSIGGCTFTVTP